VPDRHRDFTRRIRSLPRRAALIYALVGAAWIGGSGLLVSLFARTPSAVALAEVIKGWAFIAVTAAVLYTALGRFARKLLVQAEKLGEVGRHVERLNRIYALLSSVNGAILRIRDRQRLLDEVCRIAVEIGRLRTAVVMLLEGEPPAMRLAAHAGAGRGQFDTLRLSLDPSDPAAHGPLGTAVRTGSSTVVNDFDADQRLRAFDGHSRALGVRSGAGFPLRVEGAIVGALGLYAAEPGLFDAEELRLLEELAADAGLGLEIIDKSDRIEQLAFFDLVTGLPNRRLFQDRIEQAISRRSYSGRIAGVVAISIANFRRIVDSAGHRVGDALLRQVGNRLEARVRIGDTVARTNGNDFGLVLADVADEDDVAVVVGKVLDGLPQNLEVDGTEVFPVYKAGVSLHPRDGADAESLMHATRLALQAAERFEEDAYVFYSEQMNAHAQRTRKLERALHHALDHDELYPVYQPIIDVASGAPIGVETLLRWDSADLGPVSPAEFIPVAEDTGLIVRIGEWLLAQVCAQTQRWREAGVPEIAVGLNLSAVQLRDPRVADRIAETLKATDCRERGVRLYFEITESQLMQNRAVAMEQLARLKALGFDLYIDDFGTGYSSLSYLHQLPADVVKIDRSFVSRLGDSADARIMVQGIIGMAKGLGLRVVAEGVETQEELGLLRALGCDAAQGFLICKPIAGADIPHWFSTWCPPS